MDFVISSSEDSLYICSANLAEATEELLAPLAERAVASPPQTAASALASAALILPLFLLDFLHILSIQPIEFFLR